MVGAREVLGFGILLEGRRGLAGRVQRIPVSIRAPGRRLQSTKARDTGGAQIWGLKINERALNLLYLKD